MNPMPVIPPKPKPPAEKIAQTPLRLPQPMLEEVDGIASAEGYSRNETLVFLVKWAIEEYRREKDAVAVGAALPHPDGAASAPRPAPEPVDLGPLIARLEAVGDEQKLRTTFNALLGAGLLQLRLDLLEPRAEAGRKLRGG